MEKTETVFSNPSLQQSPAERVLDLLFVSRLSSLMVGAFSYLRTILTGRSFMSHCQAATHEGPACLAAPAPPPAALPRSRAPRRTPCASLNPQGRKTGRL